VSPFAFILFALLVLLGVLLLLQAQRRNGSRKKELASQVERAFSVAALERLPRSPDFEPTRLALVRALDEFSTLEGQVAALQSTRLYRANRETYVLFICTAGTGGYMKLLTRLEAARHVRTTPTILEAEFPELAATVRQ
jgi:hypothetical protein